MTSMVEHVNPQSLQLGSFEDAFQARLKHLGEQQFQRRLWAKDAGLWSSDPRVQDQIRNALGWLHVPELMQERLDLLQGFSKEVRDAGLRHVVHIGMGGSSLAPYAFQHIFGEGEAGLPLTVLDTTVPGTIFKLQETLPLEDSLFVVASKSGKTAETLALGDYFLHVLSSLKGTRAAENFAVITDPETSLAELARETGYRRVFLNYADIGGRYSALSFFGLVPATLMGLDVEELLRRALRMRRACDADVPPGENPGIMLGAAMGELARQGRDKVTFLVDPRIETFSMWLEQLLAESTGKEGAGLVPVAGEALGAPEVYGQDRQFVVIQLRDRPLAGDTAIASLQEAGHPLFVITLEDLLDVGQEFLRWEIATAVAGAILKINPFNQPNVQESKDNTDRLLSRLEKGTEFPKEEVLCEVEGLTFFGEGGKASPKKALVAFFSHAKSGAYFAIMAYLEELPETEKLLQEMRLLVRDRLRIATTVGYGPRFLHSTGQLHKGGPPIGLFLQLTADDVIDLEIPNVTYTFGIMKQAEARGDLQSLQRRGLQFLHVHLHGDVQEGLRTLQRHLQEVL
jgi:transaldolase/glucose-6-phosphate isomerase